LKTFFFNSKIFYLYCFLLAITVAAIDPVIIPIIILIAVIVLAQVHSFNYFIITIILSYIVITRTEFESIRSSIVIISTILLSFSFFRRYGLNLKGYPKLPNEVISFLLLLFCTLFVSTVYSSSVITSLIAMVRLSIFLIICYFLYSFIQNKSTIYLYITGLLLIGLIISITIYYDFIKGGFSFFISEGILARFTGLYDNPNFVGLIILISTCLIIALLHIDKFKTRKRKVLLLSLLLNNIIIFLIVASRAAVIGTIVSCFFILFFLNKKLLIKFLFTLICTTLFLFLFPPIKDFIQILIRAQDFSIREYLWDSGYEMFKDNLLTGLGPQMFKEHFYTYIPSSIISFWEMRFDLSEKNPHPHNFFLLMASENGILGIILGISIFILFFYMSIKVIKFTKNADRELYIFSITFLAIGIAVLFRSFFEVSGIMSYGYISRDLPFWIIFIILIYLYNIYNNSDQKGYKVTN
jgi:O-antigen ligase